MKQVFTLVFVIGSLIAISWRYYESTKIAPYIQGETKVVEKVVEKTVPELDKRVQEAITASSTDIQNAMDKASQDAKNRMEKEIEIRVVDKMQKELDDHKNTLEKEVGIYWRDRANIVSLVRDKAEKYGVSAQTMLAVISCESGYSIDIQSDHRYTADNVPEGYEVGDREQSFGLVQIHLPAHPTVTKEQAVNPEFAVEFMAKNIKTNPYMWTCYNKIAMN